MKIFLIGFMGCGKTFWGKKLAERVHIPFFDLDESVEKVAGESISDIFATKGEESFRRMEKELLHRITEENSSFIMATGGGTPCFYNNIDFMKRSGMAVWINCSTETLLTRLKKERPQRPLISNLSDEQLKIFIIKKYSGRKIFYQQAAVILPEEGLNLDILLNSIFHANE